MMTGRGSGSGRALDRVEVRHLCFGCIVGACRIISDSLYVWSLSLSQDVPTTVFFTVLTILWWTHDSLASNGSRRMAAVERVQFAFARNAKHTFWIFKNLSCQYMTI
jgi:hypothetical protein